MIFRGINIENAIASGHMTNPLKLERYRED